MRNFQIVVALLGLWLNVFFAGLDIYRHKVSDMTYMHVYAAIACGLLVVVNRK